MNKADLAAAQSRRLGRMQLLAQELAGLEAAYVPSPAEFELAHTLLAKLTETAITWRRLQEEAEVSVEEKTEPGPAPEPVKRAPGKGKK